MEFVEARNIKKESEASILRRPNVVGAGIGYKNGDPEQGLAVIAHVTKKKPRGLRKGHISRFQAVPKTFDGLPTDVIETGHYTAFQDPTGHFRPAPGGMSIGHYMITAGTLGMWVNYQGRKVILSNNHVLANSNDAEFGDTILQPGKFDGGEIPADTLATLEKFIPIEFEGEESDCDAINMIARSVNFISRSLGRKSQLRTYVTQAAENLVDCAIATPLRPTDVLDQMIDGTMVMGVTNFNLGDRVHKFGRTTGHTYGEIQQVDVTAMVGYGQNKIAKFVDQLMAGAMSQGGDSGSAVLDATTNEVGGLLFAGSNSTTIINRIQNVIQALGISI